MKKERKTKPLLTTLTSGCDTSAKRIKCKI